MAEDKEAGRVKIRGQNNILALTWPIFIELLLQMLVGNADQIMVGWHDPNGVGAIGNANQITNLVLLVFSVVCTAAMILISQYLGARDTRRVNQTYTASLLMNLVFGVVVSLVLIFLCPVIFRLMGVHQEIFEETCLYMRIIGGGMVFQSVYLTFTAFFRSSQMMKETMAISVGMNCLNIGGNYILINGLGPIPALGIAGAALSSDISRFVGVVVIAILFRKKFGPALSLRHLRPFPWDQFRRLLAIGLPTGGESLSYNGSQICIQSVCNLFAAYVVNTRVYANIFANVTYLFGSALSQACQVVTARLMGAGEPDRTDRNVKRALIISVAVSGVISVLLCVFCRPVYRLFTKDPDILLLAQTIMLIEIPLELGRAVNMVLCRALQACGDIRFPIGICILGAWLVAVGGGYVLGVVFDLGLAGLWIAMACDECMRALLFLWRWRQGGWRSRSLLTRN